MFKAWTDDWRGGSVGWRRLIVTMLAYVGGMVAGGMAIVVPLPSNMDSLRSLAQWQKESLEIAPGAHVAINFSGACSVQMSPTPACSQKTSPRRR
jgi:hypothetical protein